MEDVPPEKKTFPPVLKGAAMWMIFAAREIHQRAVDGQSYDGKMGSAGDTVEGKDWKGHSKERWELWVERFKKQKDLAEDEETKRMVLKALRKMRDAEQT